MRNIIILLILLILAVSCKNREADLYLFSFFKGNGQDGLHLAASTDGYKWTELNNGASFLTPNVGNDKLMRDPCIIKGPDNKFHMVWTVSWNEKGIGYANSQDLIHWSEQKYIPVMHHEPEARNCWAPELFYDEEAGQYLIYWATTIPGRFAQSDSTSESGYIHRMYYTTTKDFETFTETKLLYDDEFSVIDATIIKESAQYLMFLKNETLKPEPEKNIRIAKSSNLYGDYSKPSNPITINWVEGPTVLRLDNQWIVYFDKYRQHQMGAVISQDLVNWADISDQISFPEGTRHGTVFKVQKSILDGLTALDKK